MRWFTLLLIGCVSLQATAADINVPGVNGPTIQAAIVAANPGDVVIVAPGTYPEAINFLGKAITVRSTDPNDIGVVLNTIIDGAGVRGERAVEGHLENIGFRGSRRHYELNL